MWNGVRNWCTQNIMVFSLIVITDVGAFLGVRWLDRHILLNQATAVALCSFRFVFL
jgi:hypothetical protein